MAKIELLVKALLEWFAGNARDLPWRRTRDPYAIWTSEIMLQQTQVITVIPFWERWMRELPTIQAAAEVDSARLHKLWEGLGYYTRVRNLQKAAQVIVREHCGTFPERFEAVLELPGIGRYTAGAICSIAFNQPTPLLDGNVIRVLTRVFGIGENPKEKHVNASLWQMAEALVKQAAKLADRHQNACSHLNQSLMELGALVCTPRNAQCLVCPVKELCVAFRENRVEALPNLGVRAQATARRFMAFVIERDGEFLVRQRPDGVVNAHLWEFPNVEVPDAKAAPDAVYAAEFGGVAELSPLITVKHSITRYRITLEAYRVLFKRGKSGTRGTRHSGDWKTPGEIRALAFTAAHKRLASAAIKSIMIDR